MKFVRMVKIELINEKKGKRTGWNLPKDRKISLK